VAKSPNVYWLFNQTFGCGGFLAASALRRAAKNGLASTEAVRGHLQKLARYNTCVTMWDIPTIIATVKNSWELVRLAKGLRPSEEKNGAVGTSLGSPQDGRGAPPAIKRHREEVADRLKLSLGLLNKSRRAYSLTIAEIAAILGLSSVSDLESYFLGEKEASLALLDQISDTFGLNPGWLKFDKGARFAYKIHELHYHRGGLLGLIEELKPQMIFFVRCLNDWGYAHVAFKLTDWKYEGTRDGWNISDHVGATGQGQLYELWQSLSKIKERRELTVVGRDLPEDRYFSLIGGEIYPGTLLEGVDRYRSSWFDDFTDIDWKYPIAADRYSRHGSGFVQAQRLVRDCRDYRQQERQAPPLH
jgi:hypothetical protein